MSGTVLYLDRERPAAARKFPAWAPNLQALQNLCRGTCKTWTSTSPVRRGEPLPKWLVDELALDLQESVDGFHGVTTRPLSVGWLVQLETRTVMDVYTYGFLVTENWVTLDEHGLRIEITAAEGA